MDDVNEDQPLTQHESSDINKMKVADLLHELKIRNQILRDRKSEFLSCLQESISSNALITSSFPTTEDNIAGTIFPLLGHWELLSPDDAHIVIEDGLTVERVQYHPPTTVHDDGEMPLMHASKYNYSNYTFDHPPFLRNPKLPKKKVNHNFVKD